MRGADCLLPWIKPTPAGRPTPTKATSMRVKLPNDAIPGKTLTLYDTRGQPMYLADGRVIQCVVPDGALPGEEVVLTLPTHAAASTAPPPSAGVGAGARQRNGEAMIAERLIETLLGPKGAHAPPAVRPTEEAVPWEDTATDGTGAGTIEKIREVYEEMKLWREEADYTAALQLILERLIAVRKATPTPPPAVRSISQTAQTAAETVRKELAAARETHTWSDGSRDGTEPVCWSTFLLPATADDRRLFKIRTDMLRHPNLAGLFRWMPPTEQARAMALLGQLVSTALLEACEMFPMDTVGDGNCLLHAAALSAWGVSDRAWENPADAIRHLVCDLLRCEEFIAALLPRLRAEQMYVACVLKPTGGPLDFGSHTHATHRSRFLSRAIHGRLSPPPCAHADERMWARPCNRHVTTV